MDRRVYQERAGPQTIRRPSVYQSTRDESRRPAAPQAPPPCLLEASPPAAPEEPAVVGIALRSLAAGAPRAGPQARQAAGEVLENGRVSGIGVQAAQLVGIVPQ